MQKKSKRLVTFYRGDGSPIHAKKVRPNGACPCGSGKKAKHCCGTDTKYYNIPKGNKEE